ncbi:CBS domain-containing protein [Natronomonas marina]|uniref:CBS domain-containing protein n=1 Tax=Natronomonas marina TaxID=2961939 RepID=UPI0020CA0831|nr:CBS domain-containing protein [Natronomonas marina]
MEFFTADDVLSHSTAATPDDPVTVNLDDSIQTALKLMLENDFDQLPVVSDDGVEGTVTYKSAAKYVKSIDKPRVEKTSVKIALNTNPEFVDLDHDLFELFDTLAKDDYVLIGDQQELDGILTRYDVFYFLKHQVEPFLQIGGIEESLRHLFRASCDDLDQRIEDTFADRATHDESYEPPERLEDFSFAEYRMFIMRNLDQLPPRLSQERDMVESLLEDIRETRNALFHFRTDADEVDRDQLDMAHGYFTSVASTV